MKRLIVCCDGTWNRADQEYHGQPCPTNVIKLATRVANRDADGVLQVVSYDQGVGTGNLGDRLTGGAFGAGLADNILDGYRFLVANYEQGDQIFLFGFSRGAYTARSLGGMIRKVGILNRKSVGRYTEAIKLYRRPDATADGEAAKAFRQSFSICGDQPTPIHMVGVFDTVGALGIPLRGLRWFTKKDEQFHDVQLSRSVEHAFHALAVDEHRAPFRPTLWLTRDENQDVQQVWFAGAHSDVGGGYAETGLSDIALQWMIDRAKGVGLAFDEEAMKARPLRPDPKMGAHDSRTAFYRVARGVEREIGSGPVDPTKPEDSAKQRDSTQSLHESVLQRWRECPDWRPPAVAKFLEGNPGGGEIPAKLAPVG